MLPADALTSLENLKDHLNISGTDTDGKLEKVIARASWWLEGQTHRKFNNATQGGLKARRYNGDTGAAPSNVHPTTTVRDENFIFFDGTTKDRGGHTIRNPDTGLGEFHLPAYPVQTNAAGGVAFTLAVLSARSNAGGETWDTTALLENDQYVVDRENGVLRLLYGGFSPGSRNYRITCAAGFQYGDAQPYVPPDLEGLCLELCEAVFRNDRTVTSEKIGTWSRTFSETMRDPYREDILARYSRPVL